jgi:glutamate-1-semialdehyde 2,1-aminomutase
MWPAAACAGVPASTAAATLTATYNDLAAVKALFAANKGEVRRCAC